MKTTHRVHLILSLGAAALALLSGAPALGMGSVVASPPLDASGDDIFLISTSTSPNVILLMDNSDTMNSIEWHEDFDSEADPATYGCTAAETGYDNSLVYTFTSDSNPTHTCGGTPRTRKIYAPTNPTYWSGRYLNWYFGLDSVTDASVLSEIATEKANIEGCTQAGGGKFFDEKYRRTRFEASKQVLIDLLCLAESKGVRFGLANYRDVADAALEDPNGGYILADLGRTNPNHAAELEAEISLANTVPESPLAEALFQIYSFWMPRDAAFTPSSDQNGDATFTDFPLYQYDKFGNWTANTNLWMEDAIEFSCEKAFVVIVTDGQPSYDDFGAQLAPDPASTAAGFSDYADLIGDYNADGEVEDPGVANRHTWYLDDIAKYMYENDLDHRHLHHRVRARLDQRRLPGEDGHHGQRALLLRQERRRARLRTHRGAERHHREERLLHGRHGSVGPDLRRRRVLPELLLPPRIRGLLGGPHPRLDDHRRRRHRGQERQLRPR
jgi:hypothetical protein